MSDYTTHRNTACFVRISFLIPEEHDDTVQYERTEKSLCSLISYTSECWRMCGVSLLCRLKVPVTKFTLGRDSGEVGFLSVILSLSHLVLKGNTWLFSSHLFPGDSGNLSVKLPLSWVISLRLHLSPLLLFLCPVGLSPLLLFWPGIQLLSFTWCYRRECFQYNQAEKTLKENS